MSERPLPAARAFFASRAATWDERFPDDGPAFAAAVLELGPAPGATVIDLGCGTGRALAPLRRLVGAAGRVIAVDATWEMLLAARSAGREADGTLLAADGVRLPLADASVDAVFAAGIVHHLPGPGHGLDELARLARPHARLAVFHPIGRAALAARHGGSLSSSDLLAAPNLERVLAHYGWTLVSIDDDDDRYLAIAVRT